MKIQATLQFPKWLRAAPAVAGVLCGCSAPFDLGSLTAVTLPKATPVAAASPETAPATSTPPVADPADDGPRETGVRPAGHLSQWITEDAFRSLDQSTGDESTGNAGSSEQAEVIAPGDPQVAGDAVRDRPDASDLETLIAQALASHPSLLAARQKVAALSQRIPQARALDDPMLGNTFWPIRDQALQTAGGRVGHQFGLTQKLPWPEKLDARATVAQREVMIAQSELSAAEHSVVEAVRLAYYELWLTEETERVLRDSRSLADSLVAVTEARFATGGRQRDVLRARSEVDKVDEELISLREKKELARADLGALVRQPIELMPSAVASLPVSEAVPQLEALIGQAERCNPTLQGLTAEIARDRARETVACLEQFPDFQLGLGYAIINDNNDTISPVANGRDNLNVTLGVTLPVWRSKINAGVREAAHQRSSAIHRREAERDRLRATLRRLVAAADARIEQRTIFGERLIPRTRRTLEITTADYRGGRADFTDVVDLYRELLMYKVQLARATATLAGTLARIDRIVSCEANPGISPAPAAE